MSTCFLTTLEERINMTRQTKNAFCYMVVKKEMTVKIIGVQHLYRMGLQGTRIP